MKTDTISMKHEYTDSELAGQIEAPGAGPEKPKKGGGR